MTVPMTSRLFTRMSGTDSRSSVFDLDVKPQVGGAIAQELPDALNSGAASAHAGVERRGGASAGTRTVGADGRIDEGDSLGEVSRTCGAGAGGGIRAGSAGWVTLQLAPGRYELACNETDHYAQGMWTELVVT
jgi:hypothetical protein